MMNELLPTATSVQTRRAAWRAIRPHRRLGIGTLVVLVIATIAGLVTPRLLGRIVDLVVAGEGHSIVLAALAIPVAALLQALFQSQGAAMVARLGQTAISGIRETVVSKILQLPSERVESAGSGDVLARLSGDVEAVNDAVSGVVPTLIEAGLTIVFTAIGLVLLDWRFVVAALIAVPFQAVAVRWYLRVAVPVIRQERLAEGRRAQQLMDSIDGASTVRALRQEPQHLRKVAQASDAARELSIRMAAVQRRFFGKLNYGELVGLVLILLVGFWLVGNGTVTLGVASAAALYFHRLFDQFNAILGSFDNAQSASAAFARLVGVAEVSGPERSVYPQTGVDGAISVSGVGFDYGEGHPVLSTVDLEIAAGEQVAVVGASGAGKTTLVKLVAGILTPTTGSVRIGGVEVDRYDSAQLRRHCALLSQEVHVFADTLAANLRLANPDATDSQLHACLANVGASGWVATLSAGLDTRLGKGGHQLTATQSQQLALARLVLADPAVAILDEATAEAGSAGAKVLEQSAASALSGRTALIVAHRLTQAAKADRIVVLDAGRVTEIGTHTELVTAGGAYARLWTAWSANR